MKAFIACLAFTVGASSLEVSPSLAQSVVHAKWASYKAQHGKEYHSREESKRLNAFLSNTQLIEEHNLKFHQGLESYELGHNEFTDMSQEEFRARLGLRLPENIQEIMANTTVHVTSTGYSRPSSMDWRRHGAVQAVKNQGSCGSCYAFSAIGALETAHFRKRGSLPDLSEQQVVDCSTGTNGCNGGWTGSVYDYVQRDGGSAAQNDYKYTARRESCKAQGKNKVTRVEKHTRLPQKNADAMMDVLATVGTLSVCYNAGSPQHQAYRSGIINAPNCSLNVNHAVLLVGYGSENGVDYWILKNSWGSGWGEGGYFRMVRGKNMCGIEDWALYPTAI